MAGKGQQVRQRGPIGGAAAVTHMQGAGRVGGDEFHQHLDVLPVAAPEVCALAQHFADHRRLGLSREGEVDEARSGDLGLFDQLRGRQLGQQQGGELTRIALERLGQLQRKIGGEVAVVRLLRALQQDGDLELVRRHALQRGLEQIVQQDFRVGAHGFGSKLNAGL